MSVNELRSGPIPGIASGTCTAGCAAKLTSTAAGIIYFANAGANERACGIFLQGGSTGDKVTVAPPGTHCWASADGTSAIAAMDPLEATTGGVLIKSSTDKHNVVGFAMDVLASGTGQILVLIAPHALSV